MEIQQLKAKNHGLNTQMDALALDHERLAGLLAAAEKVQLHVLNTFSEGLGRISRKTTFFRFRVVHVCTYGEVWSSYLEVFRPWRSVRPS